MILRFLHPGGPLPQWECAEGEGHLLTAPTGWGKTLWLRRLALLQDTGATEHWWRGERLSPTQAAAFRAQWPLVFQSPFRNSDTVEAHLKRVLSVRGGQAGWEAYWTRVREGLSALGLGFDPTRRTLRELSGGEAQGLALVRSVALGTEGLLLDEPTASMDAALAERTERWFFDHYRGAFVWVTHDGAQRQRLLERGVRVLSPAPNP